ncbi:MAG: peptidase [Pseudomonadota bacterium]|nr:peptidase [Pseudomonadota bacterium]
MDKPTPPIHVFRAGKHVTAAGETIEFSQADLAATAAAYSRAIHEAPLVIGHPKTDDPAFGWAEGMTADAAGLHVAPGQVNPQFAEMVQSGAFKKISVAWYRPSDAANPVPGVWYPRHIGFLGAMPPAIKGLNPVQFRDGADLVEIEFSEWSERSVSRLFRSLRDWFLAKHGQDEADRALPGYDVDSLADEVATERAAEMARQQAEPTPIPAFSEPSHHQETSVTPEQAAAIEAENAQLKADLADRDAADKAAAIKARHSEAVQFCEGLIQAGKLLPAEKEAAVFAYEAAAGSAPVEFGEGDGKTTEAPLARVKAMLEGLPKRVEFSEVAGGKPPGAGDADPAAVAAKAVEFQESEAAAGRSINIAQAVAHVQGGAV